MTNKKKIIEIIIFLISILIVMISFFLGNNYNVSAESVYGVEQYSNDEELLQKYTSTDSLKDEAGNNLLGSIEVFAKDLKKKAGGYEVTDLTKVIPEKYVRFVEDGYTFYYIGKEYGFFVCHREKQLRQFIDVVLIDFTYEYDDIYCSNKITLLLEETLRYSNDSWFICDDLKFKKDYYIVNPSFVSAIQNENALNFGDEGYSKKSDNGVIIQKATLNFKGIVFEKDGITISENAALLKSSFCGVIDNVMGTIPYVGKAYGIISSINDVLYTLTDSLDYNEAMVSQGVEGQILHKSRGVQEQEPENVPFSRAIVTAPGQDIFLTDDDSSYMQCNTDLDNSISRTRIVQCVQFDILQTYPDEPTEGRVFMNDLDEDNKRIPFASYRENILFEDQEPKFNLAQNDVDLNGESVYLLPEGKQTIHFKPDYSGEYTLNVGQSSDVDIVVNGANGETLKSGNSIKLNGGTEYSIILNNTGKDKVISIFDISLTENRLSGQINGNNKQIVKVKIFQDGIYNFTTGNDDVSVYDIFVIEGNGYNIYPAYSGYVSTSGISIPLSENTYYFVLNNNSSASKNFDVEYSQCEERALQTQFTVNEGESNFIFYKFDVAAYGKYVCTPTNNAEVRYKILDEQLNEISVFKIDNNCIFNIPENSCDYLYVGFIVEDNTSFVINHTDIAYKWTIGEEDSEIIADNSKNWELSVGHSYEINFYVNNIEQNSDKILLQPNVNDEYISVSVSPEGKCVLKIEDNCPLGVYYTLSYYESNEERPYNYDLRIKTILTTDFKGIADITNGETVTFSFTDTGDITKVYYYVEEEGFSGKEYGEYVLPDGSAGTTISVDITAIVENLQKSMDDITVVIYRVDIQLSEMVRSLDTDYSKTENVLFGGGTGTKNDPFIIGCDRHFYNLELNRESNIYFQMTDALTIDGEGIDVFYGYLNYSDLPKDPEDWDIVNERYKITWSADVEALGIIKRNYGTIMNLQVKATLKDGDRTSVYDTGGIVGVNEGTGVIRCCSIELTLSKTLAYSGNVGGIAGINSGTIEYSWVASQVKTVGNYGGIAAINDGAIRHCRSTGSIQQEIKKSLDYFHNTCVGGIAAINNDTISSCTVGTDFDSYLYHNIVVEKIDNEQLAPYAGPIAGQNNGNISGCNAERYTIDTGNLHSWWAWFHTYDQLRNINNIT